MGKIKKPDTEKSGKSRTGKSKSSGKGKAAKSGIKNKNRKPDKKGTGIKKSALKPYYAGKVEDPYDDYSEKASLPGFEKIERITGEIEKLDPYIEKSANDALDKAVLKPKARNKVIEPLTFLDHIDAFRSKILRILFLLVAFTVAGFVFSDYLLEIMNRPFVNSGHKLNVFNITEAFLIRIKLSFCAAVFVLFPFIVYQVWNIITRRLTLKSKKFFILSLLSAIILFYIGIAFTYFLVLPASIDILLSFVSSEMFSTIGAADYINFIVIFSVILGLLFDFPVVVILLTKVGLVTPLFLSKYRRHAIVLIWIIAAVVTPTPDPFNQAVVAVPLMIFYEISIIGSKIIVKKRKNDL